MDAMTRSRATAKTAGTKFATLVAAYFAEHVDTRIERRALTGAKDRGDISGLQLGPRKRVVVECKDYGGRVEIGPWLTETEKERVNDGALAGIVVAKRRGTTNPAEQIVIMSLADLVALIIEVRP